MKKLFIYTGFTFIIFFSSCQQEVYEKTPKMSLKNQNSGNELLDLAYQQIEALGFEKKIGTTINDWISLNNYYLLNKDKHPENRMFKFILCQKVLLQFLKKYPIDKKQENGLKTFDFFAEEHKKLGGTNLEINYYLLSNLKGHWDKKKVTEFAQWAAEKGKEPLIRFKKEREKKLKNKKTPESEKEFLVIELEECNKMIAFADKLINL